MYGIFKDGFDCFVNRGTREQSNVEKEADNVFRSINTQNDCGTKSYTVLQNVLPHTSHDDTYFEKQSRYSSSQSQRFDSNRPSATRHDSFFVPPPTASENNENNPPTLEPNQFDSDDSLEDEAERHVLGERNKNVVGSSVGRKIKSSLKPQLRKHTTIDEKIEILDMLENQKMTVDDITIKTGIKRGNTQKIN